MAEWPKKFNIRGNKNKVISIAKRRTFYLFVSLELQDIEVVVQRCSVKKVFLEISQNSQENTCARVSFLIKLQVLGCFWGYHAFINYWWKNFIITTLFTYKWVILKYATTHNYPQPPTTIHNHLQPPTTTHNHPQPPTTTHNHPQSSTTTHKYSQLPKNHPQPLKKNPHNHPQPFTTPKSYPKKAKTCHKQLYVTAM